MRIYTIAGKCFLAALLFTAATQNSSAQKYTFTEGKEAVEVAKNHDDEIAVHIKLQNHTTDTLELTWQMLENGFIGDDWKMVALCDPYLCHNNIPSSFSPPLYANAAGDSMSEFKLLATATPNAKTSKMSIVVWETINPEKKDTITFTIDTKVLSVENDAMANGATSLSVYPNPAQKILNFDVETFSNNRVEIYTLSGQQMLSENLTGDTKSVNIESLPAGLYLARLTDRKGNIKVSKFSKQ